jgi:O-antigen ligase
MLIGSMLSILLFFLLIYHFFINPVNPRFAKPQEMFQNKSEVIDKTTTESSSVRVLIWQAATEIIKDNFIFGVGTGDVKDVLLEKYKEKGMTGALSERLNAHNQFLQTFIALGLPGIILLLSSFIFPFILAFRKKNFIYIVFLVIVFINFLTESMLETIAGVLFYAFFNSLLMVNINRKELSLIKD